MHYKRKGAAPALSKWPGECQARCCYSPANTEILVDKVAGWSIGDSSDRPIGLSQERLSALLGSSFGGSVRAWAGRLASK